MNCLKIAISFKAKLDTFQNCTFITPLFPYKVAGIRDIKRFFQNPLRLEENNRIEYCVYTSKTTVRILPFSNLFEAATFIKSHSIKPGQTRKL